MQTFIWSLKKESFWETSIIEYAAETTQRLPSTQAKEGLSPIPELEVLSTMHEHEQYTRISFWSPLAIWTKPFWRILIILFWERVNWEIYDSSWGCTIGNSRNAAWLMKTSSGALIGPMRSNIWGFCFFQEAIMSHGNKPMKPMKIARECLLSLFIHHYTAYNGPEIFDFEESKTRSRMKIFSPLGSRCRFWFDGFSCADGLFLFGKSLQRARVVCLNICLHL